MIRLNRNPSPRLRFKLAQTQDELAAAFKLLHDAYVAEKYMSPHPSGMRVTKYHALPSTSTLIALWDDQVVGTLSLVRDGSFGLPSDAIFDLATYRSVGTRLVEVSGLAVNRQFSHMRGEILFPLLKFMHEYCVRCFGADCLIISVNPSWIDFYEALLGFSRIKEEKIDHYSFVNGAPAVGGILDLRAAPAWYANQYGGRPETTNLYDYFCNFQIPTFEFPNRTYAKISDPVMTPELLDHFFNQKTQTFSQFSDFERHIIHQLYDSDEYRKYLPKPSATEPVREIRRSKRFDVECAGRVLMQEHGLAPIAMTVKNVADNSFGAVVERGLRLNQVYNVQIAMGNFEVFSFRAQPVRKVSNGYYGFRILNATGAWREFISTLNSELIGTEGSRVEKAMS
ncbi:MAG: N-acyl amino acid synthase FeeM domain-containing protein [Bdellovibrionia bacterium]